MFSVERKHQQNEEFKITPGFVSKGVPNSCSPKVYSFMILPKISFLTGMQ